MLAVAGCAEGLRICGQLARSVSFCSVLSLLLSGRELQNCMRSARRLLFARVVIRRTIAQRAEMFLNLS